MNPISPRFACFSALQRAENSSIRRGKRVARATALFQCSSASRKFLNIPGGGGRLADESRFSALQRAENSSIELMTREGVAVPNCFSALQRAENSSMNSVTSVSSSACGACFSALQRAENSSITAAHLVRREPAGSFSALQRAENSSIRSIGRNLDREITFQCSSASRKFLNVDRNALTIREAASFSALQRAENSSI